jgi:tetratricopeptide (TPR) repeat protein
MIGHVGARSRDAVVQAAAGAMRSVPLAIAAAVLLAGSCASDPEATTDRRDGRLALEAGSRLYESGESAGALEEFVNACIVAETCREALRPTALCFLALGRPESGAEYFTALGERYPRLAAETLRYRGYMLEKSLDPIAAERSYRDSIDAAPTAEAYELLGNLLMRRRDVAGGVRTFREGLGAFPESFRLRYLLGRALLSSGDLEESRDRLTAFVTERPGDAAAWTSLGRVHQELGESESARVAFQRALAIDETTMEARFQLARTMMRSGDLDEVRPLLRELQRVEASAGSAPGSVE